MSEIQFSKGDRVQFLAGKRNVTGSFVEMLPGTELAAVETARSRKRGAAGFGGYEFIKASDLQPVTS